MQLVQTPLYSCNGSLIISVFTQKYIEQSPGGFMIVSSLPSAAVDLIEIGSQS